MLPVAISLAACKATPQKSPAELDTEKQESLSPGETVLVSDGQSSQGVYSPKGDRFLFVSWKRSTHQQPQVYEMDLNRKNQRRITFQDGSTFFPQYHPKENWIVYSSTTDEIKENPPLLNPFVKFRKANPEPFAMPMEVYMHSLEGLEITRMSDRSGFDGEAHFSLDGNSLVWTQAIGARLQTVLHNRRGDETKLLTKSNESIGSWQASRDGSARAWLEWDAGLEASWVEVQKGKGKAVRLPLQERRARRMNLVFSPDSKWLIWAESDALKGEYDLWAADVDTLCPRPLTATPERSERYPTVSPDMKWLTYTSYQGQRSRILRAPFSPPKGPCPTGS